jgi:hypothetical protein
MMQYLLLVFTIFEVLEGLIYGGNQLQSTLDNPVLDNPVLDNPVLDNPVLDNPVLAITRSKSVAHR